MPRHRVQRPDRPVETFGIITRLSIRRGTFSGVHVPVKQIRDRINSWNQESKPFT